MEAWWMSFSFWLSIYHSWFLWEYGWIRRPWKNTILANKLSDWQRENRDPFQAFSWALKPKKLQGGSSLFFVDGRLVVFEIFRKASSSSLRDRNPAWHAWWTDTRTSCWTTYYCKGDKPLWSGVNDLKWSISWVAAHCPTNGTNFVRELSHGHDSFATHKTRRGPMCGPYLCTSCARSNILMLLNWTQEKVISRQSSSTKPSHQDLIYQL